MTTTTVPVTLGQARRGPLRLVHGELLKIRTTNTWWLFLIGVVVFTGLSLAIWMITGHSTIEAASTGGAEPFVPPEGASPAEIDAVRQQWEVEHDLNRALVSVAVNIYTSGQFFGLMFAMLLGTLLVTNEFFHQTATTTFLTTPRRTSVIFAKLGTAMLAAAFFWLFTTALNIVAGVVFFSVEGHGPQLAEWGVLRAILFNGLGYGLWGVLGVGLGVLIRNQIGAVLTGAIPYVIGTQVVQGIVFLIYSLWIKKAWVLTAMVAWPAVASQVMISTEQAYPEAPEWWVGLLVLLGYGLLFGTVGTLITRRRDIS